MPGRGFGGNGAGTGAVESLMPMAVQVTIYLNESDRWQGKPLHLMILNYLREENVFAACVLHAVAGFLGRQRV